MSKAQSEARLKMLSQPGHLYAAYSRYCDWIKIGFTLSLEDRRKNLGHQYAEFAPFSLIGSTRSTWSAEQQVHGFLEPLRQRRTGRTKELYPAVPSVVAIVKQIMKHPQWGRLEWEQARTFREWTWKMAKAPVNQDEAIRCFDRFYAERRAIQRVQAATHRASA